MNDTYATMFDLVPWNCKIQLYNLVRRRSLLSKIYHENLKKRNGIVIFIRRLVKFVGEKRNRIAYLSPILLYLWFEPFSQYENCRKRYLVEYLRSPSIWIVDINPRVSTHSFFFTREMNWTKRKEKILGNIVFL